MLYWIFLSLYHIRLHRFSPSIFCTLLITLSCIRWGKIKYEQYLFHTVTFQSKDLSVSLAIDRRGSSSVGKVRPPYQKFFFASSVCFCVTSAFLFLFSSPKSNIDPPYNTGRSLCRALFTNPFSKISVPFKRTRSFIVWMFSVCAYMERHHLLSLYLTVKIVQ